LEPEANYRNIQGNHITSPSLEVSDVYIFENIPKKNDLSYKITDIRSAIGDCKKIWKDISTLLKNHVLITKLFDLGVLEKFELKKESAQLETFINTVKESTGKIEDVLAEINDTHINLILSQNINCAVDLIQKYD